MKKVVQALKRGDILSYEDLRDSFISHIPLLDELKDTPQDPVWHAEGDVETHTKWVLEELYKLLEENEHIRRERRAVLILAALLHDVAKPLTTREREKDGRTQIIAPRHASRGRSYLAYRLFDLELSYPNLTELLNLIGLHHEPKFLVIKDRNTQGHYAYLRRLVDHELLYLLEVADMKGRDCADKKEQLEHIEFFKMFSQENGTWESFDFYEKWAPRFRKALKGKIDTDQHAFVEKAFVQGLYDYRSQKIYTPEESAARALAAGQEFSELVVTCGPSGSGKSTWIQENLPGHDVVSMDEIRQEITGDRLDQSQNGRVLQEAKERLKESLRANRNVVWDATNLRKDFRSLPLSLGRDYGAHTSLVVFHMPESDFYDRNENREHSVLKSVVTKQLDNVQFPYATEAHRTRFVRKDGLVIRDTRDEIPNV